MTTDLSRGSMLAATAAVAGLGVRGGDGGVGGGVHTVEVYTCVSRGKKLGGTRFYK